MINRFHAPVWIVPLAVAMLVAVFGWWADNRLRQTVEQQLRSELTTTLNANVTALEIWTTNQMKLATVVAEEQEVQALANHIFDAPETSPADDKQSSRTADAEKLTEYLRPRLSKIGYGFAHLVNTNFIIVYATRGRLPPGQPIHEDHNEKFSELFTSGRPVIITPFKPPKPPPRSGFGPGSRGPPDGPRPTRERGTNDFSPPDRPPATGNQRPRGDLTLMQVAAPIRDDLNVVRGALALIINPDAEFTRILSVARSGESGETYAFDSRGLMISKSRFDEQLKKMGLIENRPEAASTLNLHLTDPISESGNSTNAAAARPLTRIVGNAVNGGAGVDVRPSRDYRGVLVVGAWRWLPQHGFGVATQLDADEAYRPLHVLRRLFVFLFVLLLFSAIGMFLFSYVNVISRRRLTEAELKLKQLGQYTLEEKIGEGGMGVVYRARHALLRRDTAVKLLLPGRADAASIQRFEREVRLTCQLTHPNTIQVYDYGRTPEGIFYYAMEYLRGLNLHELIDQFGAQPEGRVIHILTQICNSLAEAHALGLVHRDIKPANVFLCNRGGVADCVKVLDFGLVREYRGLDLNQNQLTRERDLVGTPSSMAPEAIKNSARSDPRSDIYSVGALGYYLLTAHDAFESDSILDLYNQQMSARPVPPGQRTTHPISAELEKTILQCLDKDPARRPPSVEALRTRLNATLRAGEWDIESRAAWWAEHARRYEAAGEGSTRVKPAPVDATVKIDFSNRADGNGSRPS